MKPMNASEKFLKRLERNRQIVLIAALIIYFLIVFLKWSIVAGLVCMILSLLFGLEFNIKVVLLAGLLLMLLIRK